MRTLRTAGLAVLLAAAVLLAQVSDDSLVDQVRVKLTMDVDVNGGALDVAVKDGVVTLRGPVRNEKAKKKAEKIAGKVKGVKKVVNEITISATGL
jgi:osmotically-inducible protein OsmY